MKRTLKFIGIGLLVGFLVIQFFRIDKSVPEYDKTGDFTIVNSTDPAGATLLKNACYDCHSYESKYPWYSEIAPISLWIGHHIEEGREHLNFSIWTSYSAEDKAEIIEESIEEIEEGKMPDPNYVRMHDEAVLIEADKVILVNYLKSASVGIDFNSGGQGGNGQDDEDHD